MAETIATNTAFSKPLQVIPWSEKTPDWFKQNAEYYITRSNFNFGAKENNGRKDLRVLYEVYNNQFPLEWFTHITDPLSAEKPAHKAFPAKVRPVTILRTNIDLLLGEWPRRPYVYNVENLGEGGYNNFMAGLQEQVRNNLDQHFTQAALQSAQAGGQQMTPEQLQQLQQNPPTPDEVKKQYQSSYKDAIAIKAQKFLRKQIREKEIKKKQHRMFKDWLIAGQCYSFKGVRHDELVYEKISPLEIDFDKSPNEVFIEDGEWCVRRQLMTISDIVNEYWESLSEKEQVKLDQTIPYATAQGFYSHLDGLFTDENSRNKVPVYHIQWKGRKKVGFLSYMDLETFKLVEDIVVDENYKVDKAKGETIEWKWVDEVYEARRIGTDIYLEMRPVEIQRNPMNNISACKLGYNGRKYSDTHAENLSVLEMGLPFQIMYIIITYILEKTIAKSKGKILMIDQNAIPNEGDWDDEKFFYYSEALGYALLNRNQVGVDKSWNQYQVLDMTLFDSIKQLIELQAHFKQEWDDLIGINRQRKGETYSSDGQGVNERAVFQSTVITDMIFIGFEELIERELQGIMDYCKPLTAKGHKSVYNDDEYGTMIMEIFPEDFIDEDLGVFVDNSSEHIRKLQQAVGLVQAHLQNNGRLSTALDVIDAINMSDLKEKVKRIEEIEDQIAQQQQGTEAQMAQDADERKERYAKYQEVLDELLMNAEYDRKEDLAHINKSYDVLAGAKDDEPVTDPEASLKFDKLLLEREKMNKENEERLAQRGQRNQELKMKADQLEHDKNIDKQKLKLESRKISVAAKKKTTTK
jgi:hypothetical protein